MCFSATASFTAGAFLLGLSIVTMRYVRQPRELPFAAIPLLFAVQQLSEGVVWLSFKYDALQLNAIMTQFYSFFSHVLWPVYVPVAVYLLEPPGMRRRSLQMLALAGLAVGAYLLYSMIVYPIVSRPIGDHVVYLAPHFFPLVAMSLYLISVTASLLLSSHKVVKVFGALALLSFMAAYYFYAKWFISVWCFFAALMSAVVFLHFVGRDTTPCALRFRSSSERT